MTKILRSLISNLATLLLAFLAAIIIWINASQVEDPEQTQSLSIPVQFVGMPEDGILVEPDLESIQIGFKGRESVVASMTANDFAALIDVSTVPFGVETTVPIQVQYNEEIELTFQSLEETTALLEQSISRSIPIELDIRGTVARGHSQGPPLIDPEVITVSGPASVVNQLRTVRTTIFLNNARETQIYQSPQLIFYDLQGQVVSIRGLTSVSTDEVEITIPINELSGFAEKFITVDHIGEPAEGYRLLNVSVEPASVLVTGRPTQLEMLSRVIKTEQIDITGLTETTQQQVTLMLPEGIELDQAQQIFVTVEIEPEYDTASFRQVPQIQGLGENLEATITPEDVRVVLFGPVLSLQSLISDDVQVTVDLFELGTGTHIIAPNVVFPQRGIELRSIQPSSVTVDITKALTITTGLTETLSVTNTNQVTNTQRLPYLKTAVSHRFNLSIILAQPVALSYYYPFAIFSFRRRDIL